MQAVVDTFGSFGFATLPTSKRPETAALILHNEVLPFYVERGIKVGAVLTDKGRAFCGTAHHPFELYLALNSLPSGRRQPDRGTSSPEGAKVRRPQTNGFVERFHRTVLDECFRTSLREAAFDRLDELPARLDAWLVHDNHERPHRGCRNMGRNPIETISQASPAARHGG
jgi:transposase InsO family protein